VKQDRSLGLGNWLIGSLLLAVAAYPIVERQRSAQRNAESVRRTEATLFSLARGRANPLGQGRAAQLAGHPALSLRVRRLSGLLASWETIGGCGAGSSTGAGGAVRWIGRSAHGGLFDQQVMASYLRLDEGYNLGLSAQFTRDVAEKWNVGLSVPLLYKYYRDYYGLPVDVSNSGFGDVSALVTRRFGEINDTALTLSLGIPTGVHDGRYRNDYLTQEKQLGAGKLSGSLALEHTLDQDWGVAVFGASGSYRGGENDLGNYRAPVVSAYGYGGYFFGPWVPSLGLTAQRFLGVDRDRGLDQQVQLMSVTATVALEWSTDWIAILAGASLPYGWEGSAVPDGAVENDLLSAGFQPWTVSLGISVSPL
jgi:hypothetical protein